MGRPNFVNTFAKVRTGKTLDESLQPRTSEVVESGVRRYQLSDRDRRTIALERKAKQAGVSTDTIYEVYRRGLDDHDPALQKHVTAEQYAFMRVNSFVQGGAARRLDEDLYERDLGPGPSSTVDPKPEFSSPVQDDPSTSRTSKLFRKIQRIIAPDDHKETLRHYIHLLKNRPTGDNTQTAVKAANEVGKVSPREFISFIKNKVNKGELSQMLAAEYNPEGDN